LGDWATSNLEIAQSITQSPNQSPNYPIPQYNRPITQSRNHPIAAPRNPTGWRARLERMRGSPIEFDLSGYDARLAAILALEPVLRDAGDAVLASRARELIDRARAGIPLDALVVDAFALVREAARRTLGLHPFPVQIVAAIALHDGRIVEMQTGEGKTLAAVMPACLNALTGAGVHVLTFNDYLARRDADWMRPIYERVGLSVAFVQPGMTPGERRRAYAADVTYVTAKEAGFDFLRDALATRADAVVHRPFQLAIVDEADSLLIDEARVPLVIAGRVDDRPSSAQQMADLVAALEPQLDFTTDEYARSVELTDRGLARAERAIGRGSLHTDEHVMLLAELNCALHARVLLRRDVDYLVRDGRIELVDEFTGRVVDDRHWPDGLQAALETKEGLRRQAGGQILGTITLQHYFGLYPRLCGMTGTAQSAAAEVFECYGRTTTVVPTNRPMIRRDRRDVVFTHREAKERAVAEAVQRAHRDGRPVLVGTLTVEESERLASRLAADGAPCAVLNAKHDADEAAIVARAGARGAVTISTNMAGRGTDIRLGGPDEADHAAVVALGGLYVIGTDKHESRRVDLQLRGRAGRQGDPGESRFFVSLDDDLLVRYGIRTLIPARVMPGPQDAPIDVPFITREVARAQRIIEGQDLEIRRTLWRYAQPIEDQRRLVHARRQRVLAGTAGETARLVTLGIIDRAWREHLAFAADLREGIHLVRLGGGDPLARFARQITDAFHEMEARIDDEVRTALDEVAAGRSEAVLAAIKGPSATWTYLVNDDPFRRQLGMQLTGPGGVTFAIGAAMVMMPLMLLMGVVDRWWRKRRP
jgi:preprotein translocase subunit SecA